MMMMSLLKRMRDTTMSIKLRKSHTLCVVVIISVYIYMYSIVLVYVGTGGIQLPPSMNGMGSRQCSLPPCDSFNATC